MNKEETLFHAICKKLKDAEQGQLFGKLCYKTNGKAFVCFFKNAMVFKLSGDIHTEAMNLKGSQLFDPSGKRRPMKEWVQITFEHQEKWIKYASEALKYVNSK